MASSFLTNRQRDELHASILQYLAATGHRQAHDALTKDLSLDSSYDEDKAKYDGLLEKKWTSVVRLQKKILELESKVSSLQAELDNVPSSSLTVKDPTTWLPRIPKFTLLGHRQAVTSVAFHPVFTLLASGSEDTTIKIWDWEQGVLEQTLKGHTKSVTDLDFGGRPNEILLASCSSDLTIKIWSESNGYKNIKTLKGHDHTVSCVRFSADGERLASASRDKTVRIWAVDTGYCLRTITGHTDWIRSIDLSLDSESIVSVGSDQSVMVNSIRDGDCKINFQAHEHVIECCTIAPVSSYAAIASLTDSKTPIASSSRQLEYYATGARDKLIKLWDSRGNLIHTFEGHENWVRAIVFHPGGRYLLSAGDDKSIRCWDLTQGGKCVRTIDNAHDHFVCALKWAPSVITKRAANGTGSSAGAIMDPRGIRCVVASASSHLDIRLWIA
ncbi:nuclear migration protein-like protein nudF [Myxozyma melibiosi]|uniref:Nuclear distribution protein PAC1 n=1 Tax=Myxozyma melibiosi TaxID=54550 RepID=A0ABR1FBK4_9ASCO